MGSLDRMWAAVACKPQDGPTTAMLATMVVILLIPKLRKLVWDIVETILASALLLLLILMVLGLPFGESALIAFSGESASSTAHSYPSMG